MNARSARPFDKSIILAIIPCVILAVLTIFNVTESLKMVLLTICLIPYLIIKPDRGIIPLFFFVSFAVDINVSYAGVPYITVMQLIFVLKVLISKGLKRKTLGFIFAIILFQMYAILFFDLSLIKLITFILNLLIMQCIGFGMSIDNQRLSTIYISFIAGLLAILVASVSRDPAFFAGSYYRFKGIWTDQNFLAMFCGIACLFIYYWLKNNKRLYVPFIALIGVFVYFGLRTYSMSFIFCTALLVCLILIDVLNSNLKIAYKILICCLFLAIGLLIFKNIYFQIVEARGRQIYEEGVDWSHGRFTDTAIVLDKWQENLGSILFGYGINNSVSQAGVAAHNTYIELLAQLGVLMTGIIAIGVTIFCIQNRVGIKTIVVKNTSYVFILLFYMFTLSMESTDLLYLLLGLATNIQLRDKSSVTYQVIDL